MVAATLCIPASLWGLGLSLTVSHSHDVTQVTVDILQRWLDLESNILLRFLLSIGGESSSTPTA